MNIDMENLLDAVRHVESRGNPNAVSPKGAQGPYQFMPDTAKQYGVADPFNEEQSREGARRYLTDLTNQFGGNVEQAIVAYNGGPGRLQKVGGNIAQMPQESQNYLAQVMSQYGSNIIAKNVGTAAQFDQQGQPMAATDSLFPGDQGQRRQTAGALFPNNRENDLLQASVLNDQPIDKATRIYNMQLRTGLPTDLIARNLDEIEQKAKADDFDAEAFRGQSPVLAEWLAKNPTRAALAQGDYENLSALEKSWSTLQAIPVGYNQGIQEERMMMLNYRAVTGEITPQEEIERQQLGKDIQESDQQYSQGMPNWVKSAADIFGMQVPMGLEAVKHGVQYGVPMGAVAGAGLGMIGGPAAPATALAGAAMGGTVGFESAASASYIDQTYRLSVGDAYDDLEKATDANGNHIDPTAARYAALLVAVPNALMEFASMRTAVKLIPGTDKLIGKLTTNELKQVLLRPSVMSAMADFSGKYAAAVGTETFTEGMQTFLTAVSREIATGDLGKGFGKSDVENITQSATKAFKGSVVLGALAHGPKVIELYAGMEKAAQNEQFMRNLGDIANNSETFKRSPEAFGEYVKQLKENGPVKNVYIPIESWNTLFQDRAPTAAAEVFGNTKQYQEAQATGSDLVIPIETYASKLAGTQFHEKLVSDIRLNPGEMTPNEAAHAETRQPEILKGLETELADTITKEAPLNKIYEDVYAKSKAIGMSNQEANRDATMWRERLNIRAERLGVDPLTLYNEQPLTVQREYPTAVADKLITYNQQLVEPPVPFAQKLPLQGGSTNLPAATQQERMAAGAAVKAAEQSHKDHGVYGATIHPDRGNLSGAQGVAVAGYPQRGVVTEGAPTKAELETFLRRNRDIYKADKNAALGVWVDHESGKGYIDITNVLPREMAIAQGEHLGEKAVWDLGKSEEIRLPTAGNTTQQTLFQKGARGASVPIQKLIALLKGADASTFMHESAHLWLEELRTDALRPDAPAQLQQDWATIKEWSGAKDDAISKDSHEMFARGFEAYLMEGKAPSFQLREVFAQLKDWLSRIYKSMTMLDVELTPDVRSVMDRLIASDDAIKQAHDYANYDNPLLTESDMSPSEYEAYQQLNQNAKRTAEDTFRAKIMKELRREKLQAWRDEKKALEPVVRKEILDTPIYRAAYWLWSGTLPDGTKIENMAATKLDTQALLDMGVTLSDLPFRHQKDGLAPDVVANLFGFTSGEVFVKQLIGLPTLKSAIDEEVSRRIREEHGGIIVEGTSAEEAAMEVQNTQQVDVFNMELRILKRLGATREVSHPAVLKDIARQIIQRKTLKEIDPRIFREAGLRAAQEAQAAILGHEFRMGTGRNLDKAFDAKQKQILNAFLAKEAGEQRAAADKSVKTWKKFLFRSDDRLSKTYDMNMVNTARAIASVHGIGGAGNTAVGYMKTLSQYDPETYNDMRELVELASNDGRQIEDLTVADFSVVKDAIEGLWALARSSRQVEIDGKRIERDQVTGELKARINELVKPGKVRAGYDRAVTKWDKTKMGLLGSLASLKRVEHWVDAMDNGDPNGVFRKYIWQPISEPADRYRDASRIERTKYQDIAKSVPKETFKTGKIAAPELNYEFMNKAELLGALMHTGNPSNMEKFLVAGRGTGREWGAIVNGELDTSKWDTFIKRMQDTGVITKHDYKFAQSVWDLMDGLKPEAQKAHKKMYGYFFGEVTAQPITTPFGTFAGGYYPAIADPFIVEDAAIRADQAALEAHPSSYMFPTTGRGFTKERSAGYHKPLSLDLGLIPMHIDKVLRFTHLEPAVKDIGRVAIDKGFRDSLSTLDPAVGSAMLMPWLQRSALQQVEQPSAGPRMQQLDSFFHNIRTNTGAQILAFSASLGLQQFGGLGLSALKVKPTLMAGALWRYISSPSAYAAQINEASTFMRNNNSVQTMEIQRDIDNILLNPSAYDKAKAFSQQHAHFMAMGAQNLINTITWGGAYEQATRAGADEKSAVRQADSAVRETQGTFHAEDISKAEAGTAFSRMFFMFYSFFNMAANLNATEFTKAMRLNGFEAGGRALYVYTFGFLIPAVVGEAVVQAMSGDAFDPEDDGYLDNFLSIFFGGQAKMATAIVPVIGSLVQAGINKYNNKWYDDHMSVSPAVQTLEASVVNTPYDIYRMAHGDNVRMKTPIHDILTAVGMATGLPVAPLAKPIGYMTDINQGYIQEPSNPIEYARGLISGRAPK